MCSLPKQHIVLVVFGGSVVLDSTAVTHTSWAAWHMHLMLKWWILSQTGAEGNGKNLKIWIFRLGLKYTLRTCFESKNFFPKSCPELINQVLSFSEGPIYLINWVRLPDNFFNFLTSGGQVWIPYARHHKPLLIASRSWLQAALEYKPYIRTEFS
jgi:hypothetical protein